MNLENHLDKIKTFKVIAESRTMSEAAKRLHITQPSLTKLVQTLEAAVGLPLLVRGRHGVSLTDAGVNLLYFSTQTLNRLSDLEQRFLNPGDHLAGHLRIGSYASLSEYLWPDFLPIFREQYPQIRISISSIEGTSPNNLLTQDEIDILIDSEPRFCGAVSSWKLYEDHFNFYVNKVTKITYNPDNIKPITLVYCPKAFDMCNKKIIHFLEERNYFFKEKIEFDSFTAVQAYARKSPSVAVLPMRLAESDLFKGKLKQATFVGFQSGGFGQHSFAVTIHDSKKDDPKLKVLIKALRNWFKN